MKAKETTCRTCHRAVFAEHVDRDGNCCFCASPIPTPVSVQVETVKTE